MEEIKVVSTLDGTYQPSLFYKASGEKRPLIVGLHTWSMDRFNQVEAMLPWAQKLNWHLLLPEFRGPNKPHNPKPTEACGSHLAKQDIIDAIDYVCKNYAVDENAIFLVGASGGGHMALLMAGYAPERFRAIASFVPLTDVEAWYREKYHNPEGACYADDIAACCGGEPSPATSEEYKYRSPMTYAAQIARSNTSIWTGLWDRSIPCHHGLDMFTKIHKEYPGAHVYFHMFDGGHEMNLGWAEEWFKSQLPQAESKQKEVTK